MYTPSLCTSCTTSSQSHPLHRHQRLHRLLATPSGSAVDFVWWHGRKFRREWKKGLHAFRSGNAAKSYIVYRGNRELEIDGTRVLPLDTFLRRLHDGEIIG